MKAYIFVGGKIKADNIRLTPNENDLFIAADSGFENAKLLGYENRIKRIIGDFDSLNDIPKDIELIKYPPKKDSSDTQLAVEYALSLGADELHIVGGLFGRLDHTLSNLAILEDMASDRIYTVIEDGFNRARCILNHGSLLIAKSSFKYFSLIASSDVVKGVFIRGGKYPLKNATLTKKNQFAVSNEVDGNCAMVSIRKGVLFIVESNDFI